VSKFPTENVASLLKALEHPVRAQVLAALGDRTASAADIAELTDLPIAKVRYHLRALAKLGLITSKEAEDRRGVREYYWAIDTAQLVDDEQQAQLAPEQHRQISLYVLRLIFGDATAAVRDDTLVRRPDHFLVRFRPMVDERGWRELVKVYRTAFNGIAEVSQQAAKRLEKSGLDPIPVNASLLLFDLEMPERAPPTIVPERSEKRGT
jgi:DNA-binding transcriptional ArsR family regulator